MKRASFGVREFAVKTCGEPVVDFVVNGCHMPSPLKRERAKLFAQKSVRGREFLGNAPFVRPNAFSIVR